jgi:hypothetical protein
MSTSDSLFKFGTGAEKLVIGGVILVAVAGLVYWIVKRGIGGVTADVTSGVVKAVGGIATGAVKGVAETVGIPDTNQDQCSKDLAAGRMWDASFSCPASRFVKGVFSSGSSSPSSPAPQPVTLPDLSGAYTDAPSANDPSVFTVTPSIFGSGAIMN